MWYIYIYWQVHFEWVWPRNQWPWRRVADATIKTKNHFIICLVVFSINNDKIALLTRGKKLKITVDKKINLNFFLWKKVKSYFDILSSWRERKGRKWKRRYYLLNLFCLFNFCGKRSEEKCKIPIYWLNRSVLEQNNPSCLNFSFPPILEI